MAFCWMVSLLDSDCHEMETERVSESRMRNPTLDPQGWIHSNHKKSLHLGTPLHNEYHGHVNTSRPDWIF